MRSLIRQPSTALLVGSAIFAGRAAGAQGTIPVVTLPAASAVSAIHFGAVGNVRELPGGQLLVNDPAERLVELLDPALKSARVVLDSARGSDNFYGPRGMPMMSYRGDSTLVINLNARTMSVLDEHGAVARSLALPPGATLPTIRRGTSDNEGRLIFPGTPAILRRSGLGGTPPIASDSTPILRADFAARRVDTIAYVARPLMRTDVLGATGIVTSVFASNPLRELDEWEVMSDGTLAIVRGHDYKVDFVHPDGSKSSTPKLAFDWRPLNDAAKEALIDTVLAQREATARNNALVVNFDVQIGWRPQPGDAPPGAEVVHTTIDSAHALFTHNAAGLALAVLPFTRPTAAQVFDYYAPVRTGGVLADMDDHLWILPTTSKQSKAGELVYDVVNSNGALFQRVRLPVGRYIVGFGRGGVVYMAAGSLRDGFTVERTKVRLSK